MPVDKFMQKKEMIFFLTRDKPIPAISNQFHKIYLQTKKNPKR